MHAEALTSINALQTWDANKDATRDTEMKARIGGVIAQMESLISTLELNLDGYVSTWLTHSRAHCNQPSM